MNLCPRDRQTLASNDVGGYRYYSCEQCHGFWIPGGSLHRVLSAKGIAELGIVHRGDQSELLCPDCLTACDSILIQGCRLDPCPKCHGVWLDSGEAQRVRRLFPEGSAVVLADEARPPKEFSSALVAGTLTDAVGNLLLLILPR